MSAKRKHSTSEPSEPAEETRADEAAAENPEEQTPEESSENEAERLRDQLLRAHADYDNLRKRVERERVEATARAAEELMTDLLPALDHFELGLENACKHDADPALIEGFRLVYDQLQAALAKHGLQPIDAHGMAFDPNLHEAIAHVPSDEAEADHVLTQTRRGYALGGRLLRPAQVVVSSGPIPAEP